MSGTITVTRREVLGATGAAFVAGTGAVAAAPEECPPCEEPEVEDRFCLEDCVVTTEPVYGYEFCPFREPDPVVELPEGLTGFVVDRCQRECRQAVLVEFCEERFWVRSAALDLAPREECRC